MLVVGCGNLERYRRAIATGSIPGATSRGRSHGPNKLPGHLETPSNGDRAAVASSSEAYRARVLEIASQVKEQLSAETGRDGKARRPVKADLADDVGEHEKNRIPSHLSDVAQQWVRGSTAQPVNEDTLDYDNENVSDLKHSAFLDELEARTRKVAVEIEQERFAERTTQDHRIFQYLQELKATREQPHWPELLNSLEPFFDGIRADLQQADSVAWAQHESRLQELEDFVKSNTVQQRTSLETNTEAVEQMAAFLDAVAEGAAVATKVQAAAIETNSNIGRLLAENLHLWGGDDFLDEGRAWAQPPEEDVDSAAAERDEEHVVKSVGAGEAASSVKGVSAWPTGLVRKFLEEELGLCTGQFPDTIKLEDLGVDSVQEVNLLCRLQTQVDVELPESLVASTMTLGEADEILSTWLQDHARAQESAVEPPIEISLRASEGGGKNGEIAEAHVKDDEARSSGGSSTDSEGDDEYQSERQAIMETLNAATQWSRKF
ncbi:hypothetical protein KC349_g8681 [Hortaea werneckii]|nr:hypothetical protein KC349_g8681 [Hortaea werneckii]